MKDLVKDKIIKILLYQYITFPRGSKYFKPKINKLLQFDKYNFLFYRREVKISEGCVRLPIECIQYHWTSSIRQDFVNIGRN